MNLPGTRIAVKRTHALGNLVMLIPVLEKLRSTGREVCCVTRPEWAAVFQALCPDIRFTQDEVPDAIDLDQATFDLIPSAHRTDEFGKILGVPGPFAAPRFNVPEEWTKPFRDQEGAIVIAPEAAHPARCWPDKYWQELAASIGQFKLVIVGTRADPVLPFGLDLRRKLSLAELFGLLSLADTVLCLDSGILHLSAALGKRTIAIFGGVDPGFRVRAGQNVSVLQSTLKCCPCNKNETCNGAYDCLKAVTPAQVLARFRELRPPGDGTDKH